MLKISDFSLDKQKSFTPKKILSVPCTMDSSFFSLQMAPWCPNFPHQRLWFGIQLTLAMLKQCSTNIEAMLKCRFPIFQHWFLIGSTLAMLKQCWTNVEAKLKCRFPTFQRWFLIGSTMAMLKQCWTYVEAMLKLRSREYRFTHMNCSTVDIPFLSEALSGERIWVILKVANLMRKVWWLRQEEKEKKEKKLIWRFA